MGKKGKKGKKIVPANPGSFYELAMRLKKAEEEDLEVSLNRAHLRKDIEQSQNSMEMLRKKWKDVTGAKGKENIRDYCIRTWHTFEKAIEKKDLLITHLQEDLDAVVSVRKLSYKDYIGVIDESMLMFKSQVDGIYQDFIESTKKNCTEHEKYLENFENIRNAALERLRVALYCINRKETADQQQRLAKLSSKIEELKEQRLEDLRRMNLHELELDRCFKEMLEVLKNYEERMAEIKARVSKYEAEKQEIVCDDKVNFLSLKHRVELQTIKGLEAEYKQLRNKWMEFKKQSHSKSKKDAERFNKMVEVSGSAINELKRVEEKVTSIVSLERLCRKLLTAEETRNRLQLVAQNPEVGNEDEEALQQLSIEEKMKRFWELNAEYMKLNNYLNFEKQVLRDENAKLVEYLKSFKTQRTD